MPLQFPRWKYHPELAPEGKVVQTEAGLVDTPESEGWVDTTAAFDKNYKKPEPIVPEGTVPEDAPVGFIPQLFPGWRYNKDGEAREVKSQADADALEGDWRESPDPKQWADKPASTAAETKAAETHTAAPVVDPHSEAEKHELYALTVKQVERQVSSMTNRATLEKMRGYEAVNPKGTREGVIKAIDEALATLPS